MSDLKKSESFGEKFDFTKPIEKSSPIPVSNIIYNKLSQITKKQWIMTGVIFTAFILTINIPSAIANYNTNVKALEVQEKVNLAETQKVLNEQKLALAKIQTINKIEELKIEKAKEEIAIKKVKEISSSDMQNIINFIRKTQAMENARLDEVALKIKYVDEENPESGYKVGDAYKEILQNRIYVADYYNQMLNAMLITYKEANQGKITDIGTTYDDKNIVDLLEEWNTNVKINAMPSLGVIDEFIQSWEPEFTDTKGIQLYLKKHKK